MIADRAEFIRTHTSLLPVPHAPEIMLHVAEEATALWQKTEEELESIGLPPPFWAFAWAGGQALARYILDHPHEVADRNVLDVATGSGLVAIAAMKAGAASAVGVDIDPFSAEAVRINVRANGVVVTPETGDAIGREGYADVILAGDICYQADMTEAMLTWLIPLAASGRRVLIGDPGRTYLPRDRLTKLAEYAVPVNRSLEDMEIKRSAVWCLGASRPEPVRLG